MKPNKWTARTWRLLAALALIIGWPLAFIADVPLWVVCMIGFASGIAAAELWERAEEALLAHPVRPEPKAICPFPQPPKE